MAFALTTGSIADAREACRKLYAAHRKRVHRAALMPLRVDFAHAQIYPAWIDAFVTDHLAALRRPLAPVDRCQPCLQPGRLAQPAADIGGRSPVHESRADRQPRGFRRWLHRRRPTARTDSGRAREDSRPADSPLPGAADRLSPSRPDLPATEPEGAGLDTGPLKAPVVSLPPCPRPVHHGPERLLNSCWPSMVTPFNARVAAIPWSVGIPTSVVRGFLLGHDAWTVAAKSCDATCNAKEQTWRDERC